MDPENMNTAGEEFPLSEIMQDAVARILGDEHASFYRRFDGRFDSRRLDVGVNTVMMGIVGDTDEVSMANNELFCFFYFPCYYQNYFLKITFNGNKIIAI